MDIRAAEWTIDAVSAALFGASVAYACHLIGFAGAIPFGIVAAGASLAVLRHVPTQAPTFPDPRIEAVDWPSLEDAGHDLILGPAQVLPAGSGAPQTFDELLLEDIVAQLRPDSRVVRLFEPVQPSTPGELHASIDRHLRVQQSRIAPPDASQALSDALAALRRSLR